MFSLFGSSLPVIKLYWFNKLLEIDPGKEPLIEKKSQNESLVIQEENINAENLMNTLSKKKDSESEKKEQINAEKPKYYTCSHCGKVHPLWTLEIDYLTKRAVCDKCDTPLPEDVVRNLIDG